MTDKIITKPPTPEYEASYERVFGKKKTIDDFCKDFLDPYMKAKADYIIANRLHEPE